MTTRKAQAVIGAGYGDEGKGLTTDFLAAQSGDKPVVIRFNGGAQAGHTVQTPQGQRHVFGHIGSGSFAGCPTYLSRFFVANPVVFFKEYEALRNIGVRPSLMIDPAAPVTTPFDMLINQVAETMRGTARHGSCGLGFGETIERQENAPYALTVAALSDPDLLARKLRLIQTQWVPARLAALGLSSLPDPWNGYLTSTTLLDRFMEDARSFCQIVACVPMKAIAERPLLFEGAQGLLLDPCYGAFPHVTRSATGLCNVLTLCQELAVDTLDAFYVTRAYRTRHGAGPLPHETAAPPVSDFEDRTNCPNAFQGCLRFGLLDLDETARLIRLDKAQALRNQALSTLRHHLVVTCLDQTDGFVPVLYHNEKKVISAEALLAILEEQTEVTSLYGSYGPTRETVTASCSSIVSTPKQALLAFAQQS